MAKSFAGNTRAVLDKTKNDFSLLCIWINIIVQLIFMFLYGYKIFTNIDRLFYLIIYICLAVLAVTAFIVFLSTLRIRKNKTVKRTQRIFRFSKYIVNAVMLGVVIFEMYQYDTTDFNKVITIVSGVSLVVQIVIELSRMITERYINLISTAIQMDAEPYLEKIDLVYNIVHDPKGNILSIIDAIPNRIVGKKKDIENTTVFDSKIEEKINGLRVEHDKEIDEIKSIKDEEKQKRLDEFKNERHQRKKEEILNHLNELNPFRKKK